MPPAEPGVRAPTRALSRFISLFDSSLATLSLAISPRITFIISCACSSRRCSASNSAGVTPPPPPPWPWPPPPPKANPPPPPRFATCISPTLLAAAPVTIVPALPCAPLAATDGAGATASIRSQLVASSSKSEAVVCVPSQPPKKSRRVPEPRETACRLLLGSPPVSPSMTTCHTLVAVSTMMTSL